jgi:hypothetical protein
MPTDRILFQDMRLFEAIITFRVNHGVLKDFDAQSVISNLVYTLRLLFEYLFEKRAIRLHGPYPRAKQILYEGEIAPEDSLLFAFLFE